MTPQDTWAGRTDDKPCRLLDMHDCAQPLWGEINRQMAQVESLVQPSWFRPFFRVPWVRRKLGYHPPSRGWEYPWAIVNAELQSGMRLLDVGSGGSAFPVYLGLQGLKVHVADPSQNEGKANPQDWRKRLLRTLGLSFGWGLPPPRVTKGYMPVSYVSDPVQKLRYEDNGFDRVFCLSVLEHIPLEEWGACMTQLARVLRPGGRLLVTLDMSTPQADSRHYQHLCGKGNLRPLNQVEYDVPISQQDKQRRHPGWTYETLGQVWEKC